MQPLSNIDAPMAIGDCVATISKLDSLYQSAFLNPENGTPDDISKKGCLALMHLGVAAWNSWRSDFPTEGGRTNHGYGVTSQYGNIANFSNQTFEIGTDFSGFNFGSSANFENAEFNGLVSFQSAIFGEKANFDLVRFKKGATFQNARFENDVTFTLAKFSNLAFFSYAQFGGITDFTAACFTGQVSFNKVIHGQKLIFNLADFNCSPVSFVAASLEDFLSVYPLEEREPIKSWAACQNLSPGKINCAQFGGATFSSTVDFSGIEFAGQTKFSKSFIYQLNYWHERDIRGRLIFEGEKAKLLASLKTEPGKPLLFGSPPIFHNCKFNQDISFDGAEFPKPTGLESSIRAYRTLKLAFAQMQAVREEQQFFKLEMAEEHHAMRGGLRRVHALYAFISDYGFSTLRPSVLLLSTTVFALILYGLLAGYSLCLPFLSSCSPSNKWLEFGLINAIPLTGMDQYSDTLRSSLYPVTLHPVIQALVTTTLILQKSFSLLALFLIGLALRNLFKMK